MFSEEEEPVTPIYKEPKTKTGKKSQLSLSRCRYRAYLGDDIDERIGDRSQELDSVDAGRRGDEGNVRHAGLGTSVSKVDGFGGGQVDHDVAVGTGLSCVLDSFFLAISDDGVVVACGGWLLVGKDDCQRRFTNP